MKTSFSQRAIRRIAIGVWLFACLVDVSAQAPAAVNHEHNAVGGHVRSLPRDLELRLAVNALPEDLRARATIFTPYASTKKSAASGDRPHSSIAQARTA